MLIIALSALTYLLGIALIIFVVMQRKEPSVTVAWILVIVGLPVIGALLYLWFGYGRIERRVRRRQRSNQAIAEQLEETEAALKGFEIISDDDFDTPVQSELVQVTKGIDAFAITHGNDFTLLTEPEEVFAQLEESIQNAQDSIHMQYYIFRRDDTGRRIVQLLTQAAKRGVEVRLLVDGVGSWTLGDVITRPLQQAGGHFAHYQPVTFLGRPWHWNLRNHRKITVVDGALGMIGSMNIGNEYRFRTGGPHDFYDQQIVCKGPVVQQLQEVFASDWFFATRENLLEQERYFPLPERAGHSSGQIVQSGPDEERFALHEMICAALHAAERSVRIVTPYLIPDQALIVGLRTAALRGMDVQIMLASHFPTLHEHLIYFACRSYYEDLLSYGIRIFEHDQGFLHAKGISIDGAWASVGTANMDIRSFRLNFEVNVNFYSKENVAVFDDAFQHNLQHCREISLPSFNKRPYAAWCSENIMRVFSPIL